MDFTLNDIYTAIADNQDGGDIRNHRESDKYSTFMTEIINDNIDYDKPVVNGSNVVIVDEVLSNFEYMIDQLQKAVKSIEKYVTTELKEEELREQTQRMIGEVQSKIT
jgi:hypothetical protein